MTTPNIDSFFTEVAALRNNEASLRDRCGVLERALQAKTQALMWNEQRVQDLKAELSLRQQSWDKAANYRDEVLKLRDEALKLREGRVRAEACNRDLAQERDELRKQLETERMRLAAVSVVALADTEVSRVEARKMHPDYRSAALGDVERRVDECISLREENAILEKKLNERHPDILYHMDQLDRLAAYVKPQDMTSEGVVTATIKWINRLLEDNKQVKAVNNDLAEERNKLWNWKNEAMLVDKQIMSISTYVRNHGEATIGDNAWSLVGKWLQERDYLKRKLAEIKKLIL